MDKILFEFWHISIIGEHFWQKDEMIQVFRLGCSALQLTTLLSLSLSLSPSFVFYCSNNILCCSTIYSNHILSLVGKFLPEIPTVSCDKFWKGRSKQIFHSINLWKIYHGKPTNRYWHQWRLLHVHGVRASPPWRELEPRMAQTPASHYVQWQNPSEFLHQGRVHLFLYY